LDPKFLQDLKESYNLSPPEAVVFDKIVAKLNTTPTVPRIPVPRIPAVTTVKTADSRDMLKVDWELKAPEEDIFDEGTKFYWIKKRIHKTSGTMFLTRAKYVRASILLILILAHIQTMSRLQKRQESLSYSASRVEDCGS
jgi:hypothetical protein